MPSVSSLRGVLLDIDGTLIDSNDAHAQAWEEVFRAYGYDISAQRVRPLIGMGGDKLLPELTGLASEAPKAKEMSERRTRLFLEQYLPRLRVFPGARELLLRMKRDGLKLVVATSANEEELGALLRVIGVRDLVDDTTTKSDVESSKPDPDAIHAALDAGGLDPAEAVMIGDTPYDVAAARRAGVDTIALRSGGWSDEALRGAVALYDDVAALLADYDRSPLGRFSRFSARA